MIPKWMLESLDPSYMNKPDFIIHDESTYFEPHPDQHIWITADNRRIPIDDMEEDHVRNTLKCIMRKAHEGRIWALKPSTGGLRHYSKEAMMAKATVTKVVPKPVSPYEGISHIDLQITVEEAKALIAAGDHTYTGTVGGKAFQGIAKVLREAGLAREDQDIVWNPNMAFTSGIAFKR